MSILNAILNFIRALFGFTPKRPVDVPDEVPVVGEPAIVKRARQDIGLKEIKGEKDNPDIVAAWRYVDHNAVDDDETAWCSAKMCQWAEESGLPSTRAPNARSWERWGQKVAKPKLGDVAVEWRVDPKGWQGHVCLYMGPGSKAGTYMALGGNQSDMVCIQERPLSKVLSFRRPMSPSTSRTLKASTAGLVMSGMGGAVILDSTTEIMGIVGILKSLGATVPGLVITTSILSILCFAVIVWARYDDWDNKAK